MKRYVHGEGRQVEDPAVDAFLEEVIAVCRRHRLSIGHEDSHGSFIVETFKEANIDWLRSAPVEGDPMGRTHLDRFTHQETCEFTRDCLAILEYAGGGTRYQDEILMIETEPAEAYRAKLRTVMYRDKVSEWGEEPVLVTVSSPRCVTDADERGVILVIHPDRYADYYRNDTPEIRAHARMVYLANPPF